MCIFTCNSTCLYPDSTAGWPVTLSHCIRLTSRSLASELGLMYFLLSPFFWKYTRSFLGLMYLLFGLYLFALTFFTVAVWHFVYVCILIYNGLHTPHHCNPVNLHFLCLSIVRHLAFSAHHHLSCVFQALQSTIVLSSSSSTSSSSSPSMPLPSTAISDYFLQILQSHITWSKSESKKQIANCILILFSLYRNKLCSDSLFSQISKVLTGSTIWFPTLTMSPSRLQSRTNLKQNGILQTFNRNIDNVRKMVVQW